MITIRQATRDDAQALAELRWEFRSSRGTPVESHEAFIARCSTWMHAQLEDEWLAWVAEDERSTLVGHVWLRTIDKIPNPVGERERHAYLSNLYVKPSFRGGVGARLLDAAIGWASARGVDYVLLWPTPRSRTLYARRGFAVSDACLGFQFR
ncbi:MAG: GNAT family N-acetyltransferase [Acidobacteria bacterium]|nr:GNAT family N-acetyltransferase [Acidobacteriota bacterium]